MTLTAAMPGVEEVTGTRTVSRLALVIEYEGTRYRGFQLQASDPTVQGELEKALHSLTGQDIRVAGSSRTDAGVHARGQVVSFETAAGLPLDAYVHGLNHYLPDDIAVRAAHTVALTFDPRRMAAGRVYTYTMLNSNTRSPLLARFAHRLSGTLDTEAMNQACQHLIGVHDFASFASDIGDELEKSTVRNVQRAVCAREGDVVVFTIAANAFLRHQVRSTAGALAQVGLGRMSLPEFDAVLQARQPGLAGPTLPACGLCLEMVNYPATFEEMK